VLPHRPWKDERNLSRAHTTHLSPGQATEALLHGYRGAVAFVSVLQQEANIHTQYSAVSVLMHLKAGPK